MARSRVCAGRAAPAVLPCPQALARPIARFAERRSACRPQVRPRAPAKILAPGPSCVSYTAAHATMWPVVTEPTGIHHDFSNTSFAHGYSSSSLTTPARQSGLCDPCPGGKSSRDISAVRFRSTRARAPEPRRNAGGLRPRAQAATRPHPQSANARSVKEASGARRVFRFAEKRRSTHGQSRSGCKLR